MFNILRDPVWQGFSAIIALIALLISITQSKTSTRTLVQQISINIGRAIIGILIFLPSVAIYSTLVDMIQGGVPLVTKNWQDVPFAIAFFYSLNYAIFPGTITAIAASRGRDFNHSLTLASAAAFFTTSLADIFLNLSRSGASNGSLIYALIGNAIGGIVAGLIITYLVRAFNAAFAIHLP